MSLFVSVVFALLALDQLVKAIIRGLFHQGEVFPLWPGVFELTLTYNYGIAFGLFQGMGALFVPIALLIAGVGFWYCRRHPYERRLTHVALAFLTAGALGNAIDRVLLGRVTDMFWIRAINFPVFNVADVCITIAAVLLILFASREPASGPKTKPEPATESRGGWEEPEPR